MIAKVDLVYEAGKTKREEVEVKDGLRGLKLMDAIEKAVEKKFGDDPLWYRWNLIDVVTA